MDEILKKITEYRIFNFLLPGAVFAYAISTTTDVPLNTDDILLSFFLYYFIGLVVSRIGSVFIEPFLKFIKVIEFVSYEKYINASRIDSKIAAFSQDNNTYRTLISAGICYLAAYTVSTYHSSRPMNVYIVVLSISLIVLFVLSYRKQTDYIKKRIGIALKEKNS